MFAGPNGFGKSTIKSVLPKALLGVYINPDEIQKELEETQRFDLAERNISATTAELQAFLSRSTLFDTRQEVLADLIHVAIADGKINFQGQ